MLKAKLAENSFFTQLIFCEWLFILLDLLTIKNFLLNFE